MAQPKLDKFDRLLKCDIEELTAIILPMSAKECETYTRAMLARIGGPSFDKLLMRIVETMVPMDGGRPPRSSDEILLGSSGLVSQCADRKRCCRASVGIRHEDVRASVGEEAATFCRPVNVQIQIGTNVVM